MRKLKGLLLVGMLAASLGVMIGAPYFLEPEIKGVQQDPSPGDSHCPQMKDNPACINWGEGANCKCTREPTEDGECPLEGEGCKNHCCRSKCRCWHPKCIKP